MTVDIEQEPTGTRIATLEKKLARRSNVEKAMFDGDPMALPMLLLAVAIWAVEISTNAANGTGWSSAAHWLVIVPLEALAVTGLALGLRSAVWRSRLKRLKRTYTD